MRFCYFLTLFFTTVVSSYSWSQTLWEWSYPTPQGNTLRGLVLKTDALGVAIGDAGTTMRRSSGSFGLPQYPTDLTLRAGGYYLDTMWIVGDSGHIFRSTNNGTSWSSQRYSLQHLMLRGIHVRDKNTLWVVGDSGYILYSTNAGSSYTRQSNSYRSRLHDVGLGRQNVYVCGDSGTLLRGASYGSGGYAKFPTGKTFPFRGLDIDTSNVFVVGDSGYILRRTVPDEQFVTDTVLPSGVVGKSLMFNDVAYSDRYVIVVGNDGVIKRSVDTGWTWSTPTSPTSEHLYSIRFASDFASSGIAWIVGESGAFLRSTNYGASWTRLDSGIRQLVYAAGMSPIGTLFVTSAAGIAFRSTDGGATWRRDSLANAGARLTDIAFSDNGFGLLATYDNKILRTIDTGKTWTVQNVGSSSTLILGVATQGNVGLACGANGQMFRSANRGSSWSAVTSNTIRSLYDVDMFGSNAIAVGDNGAVIYSTNLGQTWTSVSSGTALRFNRVRFSTAEKAVAVAQSGGIRRTTNHGQNWTGVTSGTLEHLNDVQFHDDINGIVVGDHGIILKTTNSGASWSADNSHTPMDLKGAIVTSGTDAFVAGNKTTILFTSNSALPVELLSLSAKRLDDGSVDIGWKVAREENNRGFAIDRISSDGWSEIAFVRGAGTTNNARSYYHHDAEARRGQTAYRLRQIDLDGSQQELGTVEVSGVDHRSDIVIAPNPASGDEALVTFNIPASDHARMTLINSSGVVVATLIDAVLHAGSHSIPIDTQQLASGIYIIAVERGGIRSTYKLIVK